MLSIKVKVSVLRATVKSCLDWEMRSDEERVSRLHLIRNMLDYAVKEFGEFGEDSFIDVDEELYKFLGLW